MTMKVKHCARCGRLEPEIALKEGLCFVCEAHEMKRRANKRLGWTGAFIFGIVFWLLIACIAFGDMQTIRPKYDPVRQQEYLEIETWTKKPYPQIQEIRPDPIYSDRYHLEERYPTFSFEPETD